VQEILSMPFFDGFELIQYALEAEEEDKYFLRWAVMYQGEMDFEEFKRKIKEVNENASGDNRSAKEILETVRKIIGDADGNI